MFKILILFENQETTKKRSLKSDLDESEKYEMLQEIFHKFRLAINNNKNCAMFMSLF